MRRELPAGGARYPRWGFLLGRFKSRTLPDFPARLPRDPPLGADPSCSPDPIEAKFGDFFIVADQILTELGIWGVASSRLPPCGNRLKPVLKTASDSFP